MRLAKLSLMLVIVLDVMGQGLVIPVITTLLMHGDTLLPADASAAQRQGAFGLVMAAFFLAWFLGAAYISKLSDVIGRKTGMLICLSGAFSGYLLTVLSFALGSFWVLVVARVITGFTAGNQPIAQAALVDTSRDDEEKTRNMGQVLIAVSVGLVLGPVLGGFLSDKDLLGSLASEKLPFLAAAALCLLNIVLIVVSFSDTFERRKVKIRVVDVFLTLYHAARRPVVRKLSLVFFCSQLALNSFFVFLSDYLDQRFGFTTFQDSLALIVFGVVMAASAGLLVGPLARRFPKKAVIYVTQLVMAAGGVVVLLNPVADLSYLAIVPFVVAFGVNYPLMLTLFSAAVDETEQGWVMGVTVALFTLGAGLMSLVGGNLMAYDIRLPFLVATGAVLIAALLVFALWRGEEFRRLDPRGNDAGAGDPAA